MKTPEEIKKALAICSENEVRLSCAGCPFYEDCDNGMKDAMAYIESLEERIDLMLIQMRGDCGTCAHKLTGAAVCMECVQGDDRPNWVYEGLPEVESK